MINLAVADDDAFILEKLKRILDGFDLASWYFTSLEELDKKRNEIEFDIYILDIKFQGISGIEYARQIRKTNSRASIIFLTSYDEYAIEGYDVDALDFILKPVEEKKVINSINKALDRINKDHLIKIIENRQDVYIRASKIKYIEKKDRKLILYTDNNDFYESYCTIKEIATKLPYFIKINQSQLVNPIYIKGVSTEGSYGNVLLNSGERIYFSRRYRKKFNETYANFFLDYYD